MKMIEKNPTNICLFNTKHFGWVRKKNQGEHTVCIASCVICVGSAYKRSIEGLLSTTIKSLCIPNSAVNPHEIMS